jgi:hypothetical protein
VRKEPRGDRSKPLTVGVTVGVGDPYDVIAPLAAACFSAHTGLPSIVLGSTEFEASGLPHPAALRLLAFDYVTADRIVYFDADWLCLQPWKLDEHTGDELLACRDFVLLDEWPRQDYVFDSTAFLREPTGTPIDPEQRRDDYIEDVGVFAGLSLPPHRWVNTGLMVLHRDRHRDMIRNAVRLYLGQVGHHPLYFEQPALLRAIQDGAVRVRLLPRRFNVLAAYDRRWPAAVTGLHIKLKRHQHFIASVRAGHLRGASDVAAYFLE